MTFSMLKAFMRGCMSKFNPCSELPLKKIRFEHIFSFSVYSFEMKHVTTDQTVHVFSLPPCHRCRSPNIVPHSSDLHRNFSLICMFPFTDSFSSYNQQGSDINLFEESAPGYQAKRLHGLLVLSDF